MSAEILIIDDNPDIRNIIKDLIDEAGFKTRVAANYNQALSEIDKKLPDVAIIDVKLDKGDNDGIELLERLKKIDDEVPVIMISGHANVQMAIDSLKLGAFEFIYSNTGLTTVGQDYGSGSESVSGNSLFVRRYHGSNSYPKWTLALANLGPVSYTHLTLPTNREV